MSVPDWQIDRLVWEEGLGRLQAYRRLKAQASFRQSSGPRKPLPPGTRLVPSSSERGKWLVSCPAAEPDPTAQPAGRPEA